MGKYYVQEEKFYKDGFLEPFCTVDSFEDAIPKAKEHHARKYGKDDVVDEFHGYYGNCDAHGWIGSIQIGKKNPMRYVVSQKPIGSC